MELAGATWEEIANTRRSALLIVPIGSLEQHGPHLPLDTDTRVAVELATRLASARPGSAVAPAVAYGASGEHAAFPGTLSINHEVLAELLIELIRSARNSFAGVVLISGHGGNAEAFSKVVTLAAHEGDAVLLWGAGAKDGDAHAGRTETSLMLAIDGGTVRMELAEAGCLEPLANILPRLRAEGVRPISSNGVLGDPQGASPTEGHLILDKMTSELVGLVEARWPTAGSST